MKAIDIHAHIPRMPGLSEYGIESGLRQMFRMSDDLIRTYSPKSRAYKQERPPGGAKSE